MSDLVSSSLLLNTTASRGSGVMQRRLDSSQDDKVSLNIDTDKLSKAAKQNAKKDDDGFSFGDFLDIINPLHHIPIIGAIYRKITGDEIDPEARLIGGGLFGGAIGLALASADVAVEETTGKSTSQHAMAMLGLDDEPINRTRPETLYAGSGEPHAAPSRVRPNRANTAIHMPLSGHTARADMEQAANYNPMQTALISRLGEQSRFGINPLVAADPFGLSGKAMRLGDNVGSTLSTAVDMKQGSLNEGDDKKQTRAEEQRERLRLWTKAQG